VTNFGLKATSHESDLCIRTSTVNGPFWETAYVLRDTITHETGVFS